MNSELEKGNPTPPAFRFTICCFRNSLFIIPYSLFLLLSGCQQFVLTDASATDKVLATKYWNDLERQYSAPLVCWVVAVKPDARELYIGTNRANQIARIRDFRVTADGRVWVNSDSTLRSEEWVVVR
jgi:hypothetical protein